MNSPLFRMLRGLAVAALFYALVPSPTRAALVKTPVASGLVDPVFVTAPPVDSSRLFVLEKPGRIRVLVNDTLQATPFLDIVAQVRVGGSEMGLLGLAFHPDYATNGFLYVNYTAEPDGRTVISRFSVSTNPNLADTTSEMVLLEIPQWRTNHNGGMIAFGPSDGYLYIAMGDGGSADDPGNRAQNPDSLLGKMLRIDVDGGTPYAIPPDNPFVAPDTARHEIWAFGLRNPWRFSFDRETGDMFIADVGQNTYEEIHWQPVTSPGGENYGWRLKEGFHCFIPSTNCDTLGLLTDPVTEYTHSVGRCSITGGYVYRGCALPDLWGKYLYGDYCTGEIWSFRYDGINITDSVDHTAELGLTNFDLVSFGEDAQGELYVAGLNSGIVWRIEADPPTGGCGETLGVDSVSPAAQAVTAAANTDIVVDFALPILPASVSPQTFRVFGRWSGPMIGTRTLENANTRVRFTPSEPFFNGEWVGIALSDQILSAGGTPLETGYAWGFWIETAPALLDLQVIDTIPIRQMGEGHIQSYGAYAGDLNDDGFSDLSIPNEITVDVRVFLGDGAGGYDGFTVYDMPGGSSPSANEGADFNADGAIDLTVANGGNNQMSVLMGDGSGGYLSVTNYTAGSSVRGVAVLDLDTDGDDDIVAASRVGSHLTLFYNDGSGAFDSSLNLEANTNGETAVVAADANGDGILDIFVGAYTGQELVVLLGDGQGGLVFSHKVSAGGFPWMIAVGDINGDGHVDVASANSFANNTAVAFGDGAGHLSPVTLYSGGEFALAIDLGDIDGDGDLDLVTSHYTSGEYILRENDGSGNYINPRSYPASTAGSCITLHDRDNDGDMDMTGIDEEDDLIFLFRNGCQIEMTGDVNLSATITSADIIDLVGYVFKGGGEPEPCATAGDVNCDGDVTSADIIYLVNHVFKGGPVPCDQCTCN